MKSILCLTLLMGGVAGCAKQIPNPADPNWQYVSTHQCSPDYNAGPYVDVVAGVEHQYPGFTAYNCKGIELSVYVQNPTPAPEKTK